VGFLGRFILGTMGHRKFGRGHIVSGRPITPPNFFAFFFGQVDFLDVRVDLLRERAEGGDGGIVLLIYECHL